jgi:hypothetical protein
MATPDETAAPLASALVWAGRAGRGRRRALSNGTASGSVIPWWTLGLLDGRGAARREPALPRRHDAILGRDARMNRLASVTAVALGDVLTAGSVRR